MKNNSNYLFLQLEERNGEYEYRHHSVHELDDNKKSSAEKFVKKYLKEFYGGESDKEDDGYYFYNGEIFVRINSWDFISEIEYNVLKRYL